MLVVMKPSSTPAEVESVVRLLDEMGARSRVVPGPERSVVELLEVPERFDQTRLQSTPMVERVLVEPAPLLAVEQPAGSQTREIQLDSGAVIGGRRLGIIAGPCSVEDQDRLLETAEAVAEAGAIGLRGGAFKPRTSPYTFQGLEERGLEILARARERTGLAIVTEVMSPTQVEAVAAVADVLQVGSRNMHNSPLLKAVGSQPKPVLLKRGWSATLAELLQAAEYILHAGNRNVILCERGIRTHEDYVSNTLALAIVPEIRRRSHLPIIVDPSHGTGHAHLVAPMSRAAIACGADGLLIEVHPSPDRAWSDGPQTLSIDGFRALMRDLDTVARACGRTV